MQVVTKPVVLGGALCCAAAVASAGGAGVCVTQPPFGFSSHYSDGVPGQFYETRFADNFTPPPGMVISGITWWGASENYMNPDLTNFTDFVVEVLNARFGKVWTSTLPTTSVAVETTGVTAPGGGIEWRFFAELPVRIPPHGLEEHWVSIGSVNQDPGGDAFNWSVSESGGSVVAIMDPFDGQTPFVPQTLPFGQAFEICFEPSQILLHPADQIVVAPGAAMFDVQVQVIEPPLRSTTHTFQWMRDGEPLVDGGAISGALSPTLVIDPATPADAGVYTVVVSDGEVAEMSRPAYLGVRACAGDANADGLINFSDLNAVLVFFGFGCDTD